MTCKNNIKKAPAQQLPLAAGLGLFTYLPKRLDLVRAFGITSPFGGCFGIVRTVRHIEFELH